MHQPLFSELQRTTGFAASNSIYISCGASFSTDTSYGNQCNLELSDLRGPVKEWINRYVEITKPDGVVICNGTAEQDVLFKRQLVEKGVLIPLTKYDNCFLARTDPADVARVESKTYISTDNPLDTIPCLPQVVPKNDDSGDLLNDPEHVIRTKLGNWISPIALDTHFSNLLPGCMKGRTMFVIPFSMGPVGGALSQIGIQITDSSYVAINMSIMTRVSTKIFDMIRDGQSYVKCVHSVGKPLAQGESDVKWPCNPVNTIIAHKPNCNEIISYGSGYGGNSLLGKKCFALRIGSTLARKQGWLAEHMLIMGVQGPKDAKPTYITAAFPSCCGKTNLAMLQPTIPGYKMTVVGDDIAWLRFDKDGQLKAINPENGFFGVAPGTSNKSNPIAMQSIFKDTIFTNVALTDDGGVWWEDMDEEIPNGHLIDWTGQDWTVGCGRKAAHPNSRFCAPIANCPNLEAEHVTKEGVPIKAILFGGRRPEGVPLVFESFSWNHGVFLGAALKSQVTAAAEHKGKAVMHDPFSMRPFFGYNFGQYLSHWLGLIKSHDEKDLPRIYMVNWFRKGDNGKFLWPGFGENTRVLDWIMRRIKEPSANQIEESAVGKLPTKESFDFTGLKFDDSNWSQLFSLPKKFWIDEVDELRTYFKENVGGSLPSEIDDELKKLNDRLQKMK